MLQAEFAQSVRQHRDIPLTEIGRYPDLADALQAWQQSDGRRAPRSIDPGAMPKALLPYVMLLDLEENPDRLRVRLAGTHVCQKYGGELRGRTTDDFFSPTDARHVVNAALTVAQLGIPSLAERTYVNLDGGLWSYVRLIAPLSRNGTRIDSFFKVLDPSSLQNHVSAA
ncbi:PAS domain-containing protein [Dongia rigui]|uniref:PAS domain-containing protein n=1 Tax=Dongia rigui TaxID=940149 RepID=A0ABU5DWZ0_9PROT|nr:PAS domain-containing protein [Dongia rigui]MDY0871096.1 PAS domain-containing protein [Dongia rigui]